MEILKRRSMLKENFISLYSEKNKKQIGKIYDNLEEMLTSYKIGSDYHKWVVMINTRVLKELDEQFTIIFKKDCEVLECPVRISIEAEQDIKNMFDVDLEEEIKELFAYEVYTKITEKNTVNSKNIFVNHCWFLNRKNKSGVSPKEFGTISIGF